MHSIHELASRRRANTLGVLDDLIYRWSPRKMTGEPLSAADLEPLFEAARWAPSSFNNQPWRFRYAPRETEGFDILFGCLMDANKAWCRHAGCLTALVSKTTFDHNGEPMRTHAHDAGAAWHALAIEATRRNLVAHAMAGFDYDAATEALGLGDEYAVQCMIALGHPAPETEGEDVSDRRPVAEIAIEFP